MTGLGEFPPFTPEDLQVIRDNRALMLRTLDARWAHLDQERAELGGDMLNREPARRLLDEQLRLERLIEVFR